MAVTNQFQQVSGMEVSAISGGRISITVAMMLIAPSSDPTQKMAMLNSQRVWPKPSPGPVMPPMALSGG